MRFLRILPEVCARTSCSLSSLTRNIALGSNSVTVPENSIRSSFAINTHPNEYSRPGTADPKTGARVTAEARRGGNLACGPADLNGPAAVRPAHTIGVGRSGNRAWIRAISPSRTWR